MNDELLQRIERLERRNKLLFGLLVILCAGFGVLILAGASKGIPDELVAHSIGVIGPDGKNAIFLGASRDGWATLSFRGLDGKLHAVLMLTPSGKPSLGMSDGKRDRLVLGVIEGSQGKSDTFSMELRNSTGQLVWQPNAENPY